MGRARPLAIEFVLGLIFIGVTAAPTRARPDVTDATPCARKGEDELPGSQHAMDSPLWVCGYAGFGCVADPSVDDPTVGRCGPCEDDGDCGGRACDDGTCSRIGVRTVDLPPIRPKRFLLTGTSLGFVREGRKVSDTDFDTGLGAIYQIGTRRSTVERFPDGSEVHTVPSAVAVHLGATWLSGDGDSVLQELGLVWRRHGLVSRTGVNLAGQWYGAPSLWNDAHYRAGLSLHLEIKHNLILKGGYLMGSDRDVGFVGIEFTRRLWDDFRKVELR